MGGGGAGPADIRELSGLPPGAIGQFAGQGSLGFTQQDEFTRIELSILGVVDKVLSGEGCGRCEILHRMKGQLIEFRRCLEEQG